MDQRARLGSMQPAVGELTTPVFPIGDDEAIRVRPRAIDPKVRDGRSGQELDVDTHGEKGVHGRHSELRGFQSAAQTPQGGKIVAPQGTLARRLSPEKGSSLDRRGGSQAEADELSGEILQRRCCGSVAAQRL